MLDQSVFVGRYGRICSSNSVVLKTATLAAVAVMLVVIRRSLGSPIFMRFRCGLN